VIVNTVYVLCALTSLICAVLLFRGFGRTKAQLLLWSGLCFAGFFINNALLFFDKVVVTDVDLRLARALSGFIAVFLLTYGLIKESRP